MKIATLILFAWQFAPTASSVECLGPDKILIGNTRGSSDIVQYKNNGGAAARILLTGTVSGLEAPDHLIYKEDYYYISTGDTVETSAIVRVSVDTLEVETFATGGGLKRPYGFAFYDEILYVASFLTDQVLMYSAETGDYLGVFAQGNRKEKGLCNGPNQIDIYDGKLYLKTQGSFIDEEGNLTYAFASQVVVYDLDKKKGSVFIGQPVPDPNGLGFISMLGIKIICGELSLVDDDCSVFTTDFAGGLRIYKLSDQTLVKQVSTTYAAGAATGSLDLGPDGTVYIPGFTDESNGVLMSYKPSDDGIEVIYGPEGKLTRPIGVLYLDCD